MHRFPLKKIVRRAELSTCAEPQGCIVHDAEPHARIRILPLNEHVARIGLVVAQLALAARPHEIFFRTTWRHLST
jgi:hypothetical protein